MVIPKFVLKILYLADKTENSRLKIVKCVKFRCSYTNINLFQFPMNLISNI